MYYETLTDLLNNDPAAYEYFYGLSPEMQTALQQQGGIRSLSQLRQGACRRAAPAPPRCVLREGRQKEDGGSRPLFLRIMRMYRHRTASTASFPAGDRSHPPSAR